MAKVRPDSLDQAARWELIDGVRQLSRIRGVVYWRSPRWKHSQPFRTFPDQAEAAHAIQEARRRAREAYPALPEPRPMILRSVQAKKPTP